MKGYVLIGANFVFEKNRQQQNVCSVSPISNLHSNTKSKQPNIEQKMSGKKRDGVYFFYEFSVYPQRHMLFELNAVLMQSIFASFVVSFSVFLVHHHDVVSCTHITTLLRFRFMQCGHHEHALKVYQIEVGSSFALYLSCSASLQLLRLL